MTHFEEFNRVVALVGMVKSENEEYSRNREYVQNIEKNCPPIHMFAHAFHENSLRAIRRVYREFSGTEFKDSADAIARTQPAMFAEFKSSFFEAYSSGILVGHQTSEVVKKHGENWGELAHDEEFRAEAMLLSTEFQDDQEMVNQFEDYYKWSVKTFAEASGFTNTPKEVVHKVWDVYRFIHEACANCLFAAGYELGKIKHTEDVLNGIMEVTDE